jgi:hypothetical protein
MTTDRTNTERQARWRARQAENAKLVEEYRRMKEEGVNNATQEDTVSNERLKEELSRLKAENARLAEECGHIKEASADTTQEDTVSNADKIKRLQEELAAWQNACRVAEETAAYLEGANSGIFDKKTYTLILNCLHPDSQPHDRRDRYNKAFVAFNNLKKALLKPEPKPIPQARPLPTKEELRKMVARRHGERDRKNKERAQKAAATRKANKRPKRELTVSNGNG